MQPVGGVKVSFQVLQASVASPKQIALCITGVENRTQFGSSRSLLLEKLTFIFDFVDATITFSLQSKGAVYEISNIRKYRK